MLQNLFGNRKANGLVLAGLAAYALYRYSKMSAQQKSDLTRNLKEKGKSLVGHVMPDGLKNAFGNAGQHKSYSGAEVL